jgi:ribosome-binding protein aMBF1 (putative translation factor)
MKVHCPRCDRRIADLAHVEKVGVQMAVCRRCNIHAYATYEHKDGGDYWDVHFEHPRSKQDSSAGFLGCFVVALILFAVFIYFAQMTD